MSQLLTPTASSSFFAGIGLWSVIWSAIYKLDKVAKLIRCDRWISKEATFAWIRDNKVISLLLTEIVNFGTHGITNPASTVFALGGTFVNIIMIFIVVPAQYMAKRAFGLT